MLVGQDATGVADLWTKLAAQVTIPTYTGYDSVKPQLHGLFSS